MERKSEVPVLILGFNRAGLIRKVILETLKFNDGPIYVWLDGPRPDEPRDVEKCRHVQETVDELLDGHQAKVVSNRSNLGCKNSVSAGITWFFEHVDRGAILEDDCLPSRDFFVFMEKMLNHFEADTRVLSISGHCQNPKWIDLKESFHFSRYPLIWGWGTWKEVWAQYDPSIEKWGSLRRTRWLRKTTGLTVDAARFWRRRFDQAHYGRIDTWDYQFTFLAFLLDGLNVAPHRNMIQNIGFGPEATHTKEHPPQWLVESHHPVGTVVFPSEKAVDVQLDREFELQIFRTKRKLLEYFSLAVTELKFRFPARPLR